MDQGIVQFGPYPEDEYIASIEGGTKKPFLIPFQGLNHNKKSLVISWGYSIEMAKIKQTLRIPIIPKTTMIIKGPSPTPYKTDKAVPWSYDSTVYINRVKQESEPSASQGLAISNITETGGMTRSR